MLGLINPIAPGNRAVASYSWAAKGTTTEGPGPSLQIWCGSYCPLSVLSSCPLHLLCKLCVEEGGGPSDQEGGQRREGKLCLTSHVLLSLAPALPTALQGVRLKYLWGLCRASWQTTLSSMAGEIHLVCMLKSPSLANE